MSADEILKQKSNSTKQTTNEPIDGTPFRIIGNEEQGYCITLGKYKITEPADTEIDASAKLHNEMWNIITNLIIIMPDIQKEFMTDLLKKEAGRQKK